MMPVYATAHVERDQPLDLGRFRLRTFLAELITNGELDVRCEDIKLSDVAALFDGNPKAVLLERVGPEAQALVGNVMGSRARMARAFGTAPRHLGAEITRRLQLKPEIVDIPPAQAPVQQVVLTGRDADLTKLPVHLQHAKDGGPYISAAMDFTIDAATGWTNVGLRRLMLRGRSETGIDLVAPSDLRTIYLAAVQKKEPLPLSIVVGGHPIDYFAATMRLPVDELGLIASLRAAPLPVVKCVTNDIRVPADAEWVIEGILDAAGYIEPEGPYGEFLGYYGGVKTNPIFRVTAITRRHDAVFQTLSISGKTMSRTDTAQLCALRTEILVWRALETAVREPIDVFANPCCGGVYNVRIALRQRWPGEARNAIAAVFGSVANAKNVFVVDSDIDIFSEEQMDWALGTRFQPDRDLIVQGGFRASPLDPSLQGARVGSKAGFDLTLPFGGAEGLDMTIPEPPRYEGQSFPSIAGALEDGAKFFEELMAAVSSDDGREVVVALDELRARGLLNRSMADGRYCLAKPVSA